MIAAHLPHTLKSPDGTYLSTIHSFLDRVVTEKVTTLFMYRTFIAKASNVQTQSISHISLIIRNSCRRFCHGIDGSSHAAKSSLQAAHRKNKREKTVRDTRTRYMRLMVELHTNPVSRWNRFKPLRHGYQNYKDKRSIQYTHRNVDVAIFFGNPLGNLYLKPTASITLLMMIDNTASEAHVTS